MDELSAEHFVAALLLVRLILRVLLYRLQEVVP